MIPYFFRKYHAAIQAHGYSRNACMRVSFTAVSLSPVGTVRVTGWAE